MCRSAAQGDTKGKLACYILKSPNPSRSPWHLPRDLVTFPLLPTNPCDKNGEVRNPAAKGVYIFTSPAGRIPPETWWEDGELAKEELITFWNRRSRDVSRNLNLRVQPEVQSKLSWATSSPGIILYSVAKVATGDRREHIQLQLETLAFSKQRWVGYEREIVVLLKVVPWLLVQAAC